MMLDKDAHCPYTHKMILQHNNNVVRNKKLIKAI
jgi:hypothetical protein